MNAKQFLFNADEFQSEENNDDNPRSSISSKKDKKKQKLGEVLDQIDWHSESNSSSESCNTDDRFPKVNHHKMSIVLCIYFTI